MSNITVTMPMEEFEALKMEVAAAKGNTRDILYGLAGEVREDQKWVGLDNTHELRYLVDYLRSRRTK